MIIIISLIVVCAHSGASDLREPILKEIDEQVVIKNILYVIQQQCFGKF